jgi:uncharacterized protein with von Willebrand factor type A (vWA) domain
VSRRDDLPAYDRVFTAFFGGGGRTATLLPPPPRARRHGVTVERASAGNGREASDAEAVLASPAERLRRKSFAACTPEELRELAALIAKLRLRPAQRRTRRRRPAATPDLDVRRTVRRALRTGGDPALLARRARQLRPRRVVLLLDVSRSMTPYSRALLVFAHAALRVAPGWEAFCFGTRLTRLTGALATRDPDEALDRVTNAALDWDGGTRTGPSLKAFLDRYGHAGVARGAIVVVCSDGLDTGEPELLGEQMARLSRLAHLVIWLNPLKADPRYEPLARGMAAALPHVDVFAAGHDLASLEQLGAELARNL